MKKIILSLTCILFFNLLQAANVSVNPLATSLMVVVPGTNTKISLTNFLSLTPKEYANNYGIKLSLVKKLQLKLLQQKLRKLIDADGQVNFSKLKSKKGFFSKWSWHWGGFALGFLPILGPIVALFINDDYKWDRFHTALAVNGVIAAALAIGLGAAGGF
jgi:hypothetical protein